MTIDLGRQGLRVPRIGWGGLAASGAYGRIDEAQVISLIHRAIDLGVCLIDTADVYGAHENERLIGRAIADRRESVVLATKFGNVIQPDGSRLVDGRPEYARVACDASLQRLGVEQLDLYYLHRVDKNVPVEETVGAMAELVQAGKVRYIGLSEASPANIRKAHQTHPISALQSEYSLWERGLEPEVLPAIRELGIGLVAFSPLGRGFLTGVIRAQSDLDADDGRRAFPRFEPDNIRANMQIVDTIRQIASERQTTTAQIALAWVLAQGPDIVAIPGTRSITHLEDNLGADAIELTAEELSALESAAPLGGTAGARYPADFAARLDP
jgi:aryl-alcohol dehydrogenase-like predicted oxidoreductase